MRTRTRSGRSTLLLGAVIAMLLAASAFAGLAIAHDGDGDHHSDDPAGTIASFDRDSGKLTIDLGDGGSISGTVTKWTWIDAGEKCGGDQGGETSRKQLHGWDCQEGGSHAGDRGYRHRLWGDHGDRHGWRHHDRGDVSDLVQGAVVEDSLMVLKDGEAFYAKIDLEG